MASILLVDNETEWCDLIRQALPEHDVGQAQSYKEALGLLRGDATYDVAIVDLNLLKTGSDRLGGRLLEIMRDQYPSIRRIALTGLPPTAVKAVLDQYDVDDLLLKSHIDLAVVREVVELALERTSNDVSRDLRDEKSEMSASLRSWKTNIQLGLQQRGQTLKNDVLDAERQGKRAEDSERGLEVLEAMQRNLEADYSELTKLVSSIRTDQEMMHASQEFERLKNKFQG